MNLKWNYELTGDQRSNPVVDTADVYLPDKVRYPTDAELLTVFTTKAYTLQTWGRTRGVLEDDPHWIAVRGGTPLHYDPRYPRYSHHLKIRVDPGVSVRGLDLAELPLKRGTYYVLDARSPHQVVHEGEGEGWNVAASVDSKKVLLFEAVLPLLLAFVATSPFVKEGGKWTK